MNIAIVGATGNVGRKLLEVIEKLNFEFSELHLIASDKSVGKKITFKNKTYTFVGLSDFDFSKVKIAFFSAGSAIAEKWAPIAAKKTIVIDNSKHFRMSKDIPLVVPEVNPEALKLYKNKNIISNANCSTIQMVVALKPIHDQYRIRRVFVSTYQSVSGSGQKAIEELKQQSRDILDGKSVQNNVYPHQIAFNCLPHIDVFMENGYTKEEMKMVNETHKILGDSTIEISPTAVRVPVFYSHSESVRVETELPMEVDKVKSLLSSSPGISLVDNPEKNEYPLAVDACGKGGVFVGRVRADLTKDNAINFWVVSDNLLKGAAYNAVQIAELVLKRLGN